MINATYKRKLLTNGDSRREAHVNVSKNNFDDKKCRYLDETSEK